MTDGSPVTHPLLDTAPTAYTSTNPTKAADNCPCFGELCSQAKGCESLSKSMSLG